MPDPDRAPILLLTRPMAAAQRFAQQLGLQVETIFSPLMRIDCLNIAPQTGDLQGIILTSENGAFAAGQIADLPRVAWCVGARTAEVAKEQGFDPISADGDAQNLISLILSRGVPGPLLHLHGEHVRGDVTGRLNAAGVVARATVAYRQHSQPLTQIALNALTGNRPVILPLFSPRTVTILGQSGPFNAPLHVIAIGKTVAELALGLHPTSVIQSKSPDAASMTRAVRDCLKFVSI